MATSKKEQLPQTSEEDISTALAEVNLVSEQVDVVIEDEAGRNAESEVWRARAKNERDRGIKHLAMRHEGVASEIIDVKLNERVVASAFERFFPVIENGLFVINKQASRFIGAEGAAKIMETVHNKITQIKSRADSEQAAMKIQIDVHSQDENFTVPTYLNPAASHSVQCRHRVSSNVCRLFMQHDYIVAQLQALSWNQQIEISEIDDFEKQLKKDFRSLATFISQTLRGLRKKMTARLQALPPKAAAADATAAPTIAASQTPATTADTSDKEQASLVGEPA